MLDVFFIVYLCNRFVKGIKRSCQKWMKVKFERMVHPFSISCKYTKYQLGIYYWLERTKTNYIWACSLLSDIEDACWEDQNICSAISFLWVFRKSHQWLRNKCLVWISVKFFQYPSSSYHSFRLKYLHWNLIEEKCITSTGSVGRWITRRKEHVRIEKGATTEEEEK